MLTPYGWQLVTERAGIGYWQKPGGSGREHHATTNYADSDCLYVFTPLTDLPDSQGLTKFAAYTYLEHGGDFKCSAKALEGLGYGGPPYQGKQERPETEWPAPVPLPAELLPVKPFSFDLLPESLRPWVQDIVDRVQCPPDYVAVGVMTCLGSIIGRKVGIRPQARTDWTETPNQWGLVVGRPGVLKSPALEQSSPAMAR